VLYIQYTEYNTENSIERQAG